MINQEEYEMLTELGDKWKWIARDGFKGKLNVYNVRPTRSYFKNWWLTSKWLGRSKTILPYFFPFIQWADSEPYFIPDLIKEYEEMKKDKEWLKEKVETYFSNWWSNPNTYTTHDLMDSVKHLINQLDEPEVLSQKWISEKSIDTHVDTVNGDIQATFILDDLENLIVPKKELPVIPRFVAEYIEWFKNDFEHNFAADIDLIINLIQVSHKFSRRKKIKSWISKSGNPQKLIDAYRWGYEVEEEPLYRARLKIITDEFIAASYLRTQSTDAEDRLKALEIGSRYTHEDYRHLSEFTEDELERLDIWDSEQWEVEEVEE